MMLTPDDHETWMSTAAPVAARLRMRAGTSARTIVDGAWWPRSRDPVTELTNLVAALDARHTAVINVMLNPVGWDSHPRRIRAADRRIRLSWFSSLDASLVIATTADGHRVDLLVVAPDAPPAAARMSIEMATKGAPTLHARDIAATVSAQPPGRPRTLAGQEAAPGRLNGHAVRRPP